MSERALVLAVLTSLTVSACAVERTFTRPQIDAAKLVTVIGYLKFGFENRNLYPSKNWRADLRRGECLPIGVRSSNSTLLAQAAQLDGRRVAVTGSIDRVTQPDEINASFCKGVGLIAENIEAR
jgi:hypothetical protein